MKPDSADQTFQRLKTRQIFNSSSPHLGLVLRINFEMTKYHSALWHTMPWKHKFGVPSKYLKLHEFTLTCSDRYLEISTAFDKSKVFNGRLCHVECRTASFNNTKLWGILQNICMHVLSKHRLWGENSPILLLINYWLKVYGDRSVGRQLGTGRTSHMILDFRSCDLKLQFTWPRRNTTWPIKR